MDIAKVGSLLAYVASTIPNINLRKLIKQIFLIDEKSVTESGLSITWLDYYAWKKGPVAPCVYEVKNKENLLYARVKSDDIPKKYQILFDEVLQNLGHKRREMQE